MRRGWSASEYVVRCLSLAPSSEASPGPRLSALSSLDEFACDLSISQ